MQLRVETTQSLCSLILQPYHLISQAPVSDLWNILIDSHLGYFFTSCKRSPVRVYSPCIISRAASNIQSRSFHLIVFHVRCACSMSTQPQPPSTKAKENVRSFSNFKGWKRMLCKAQFDFQLQLFFSSPTVRTVFSLDL